MLNVEDSKGGIQDMEEDSGSRMEEDDEDKAMTFNLLRLQQF